MKKRLALLSIVLGISTNVFASANLMDAYYQALCNDQIFQQAFAKSFSDKEGVPISRSFLLPSANIQTIPVIGRTETTSNIPTISGLGTSRGYNVQLTVTQVLFDFGKFASLRGAKAISKQADATLSAALQDLMVRVSRAYFAILNDEENLNYTVASKNAYAKQLDQVTQQYNVGLKTITDVYTVKASYETSQANYIAAITQLENDRENLRVITGTFYPNIAKLGENFPLVTPNPSNVDVWVKTAECQNWSIKAAKYSAEAARQRVKQEFSGGLPNLQAQGIYNYNFDSSSQFVSPIAGGEELGIGGRTTIKSTSANFTLNIPLVQGGLVVANTQRAQFDYKNALANLNQTYLTTLNNARQSFNNVNSSISKISADKEAIKAAISSWEGLKAAYEVGTGTLIDVVIQQQNVVNAQKQYANDRYAYVNNLIALKAAAGTLSVQDLEAINCWLVQDNELYPAMSSVITPTKGPFPACSCSPKAYAKKHHKKNLNKGKSAMKLGDASKYIHPY